MQVPTALWISILVGATSIVNTYYGDLWFAPVVVAAIAAVVKLIQVNTKPAETARGLGREGELVEEHSKFRQFLVG